MRCGAEIHFGVSNFGIYADHAERALNNHGFMIPLLRWDRTSAHTEISVFDENFPTAEGCGYHDPQNGADGHRTHSHSVYNRDCGGDPNFVQGVYCQEIGHAWSQEHHNEQNSCMGFSYWQTDGFYITDHDALDFYDFYRYHN